MKSKSIIKKEPSTIYKLWHYAMSILFDGIKNASCNSREIKLPPTIAEYSLKKKLSQNRYAVGVYKDKKGRVAIAKVWQGNRKNLAYFALRHEAIASEILTKAIKRKNKKMPYYFRLIKLAKFIRAIEDQNSFILITQLAKGKALGQMDNKNIVQSYDLCVNFLRYLGNSLTKREKQFITGKTGLDFLLLIIPVALFAALKQPRLTRKILHGLLTFLIGLPALLTDKKQTLMHGDLHPGNMIVSGRRITLIDLEQTFFTYPLYEYISTILSGASAGELSAEISKRIERESIEDITSAATLSGLIAFRSLHYLTGNTSRFNINLYSKILSFGNVLLQRFAVNRMSKLDFGIRLNILLFER